MVAKEKIECTAYLHELIPTSTDNDRVLRVGTEANARHPLGVALVGDGVLAITQSVPQLDCPVAGARDDLAVVGREGDRQDVVGVADKSTGGLARRELPQPQGLVPGAGKSIGTVRRDDLHFRRFPGQPIHSIIRPNFLIIFMLSTSQISRREGVRTQSETMWEWPRRLRLG